MHALTLQRLRNDMLLDSCSYWLHARHKLTSGNDAVSTTAALAVPTVHVRGAMRVAARGLLAPVQNNTLLGCTSRVVGCSGAPLLKPCFCSVQGQLRLNWRSQLVREASLFCREHMHTKHLQN